MGRYALGNLVEFRKGKTVQTSLTQDAENALVYLTIDAMENGIRTYGNGGITAKANDILVVGDGSRSGLTFYGHEGIVASTVIRIRINSDVLNPKYLFFLSQHNKWSSSEFKKGSTVPHFNYKMLADQAMILPSIKAQVRIVTILETIDEAIESASQLVSETEKIRHALLQQSFNCDWTVVKLESVAKRGSGHTPNKKIESYYNGGIGWVSLADTSKLDNGIINHTSLEISQAGIDNSSAVIHSPGSVVLSRDAGVGKSAILGEAMAVSQHFIVWECSKNLHNWYLYYFLQSKKREFERIAVGSTIKTIGLQYFKDMDIALPPIEKQVKIANMLIAIDAKIKVNKEIRSRYEKLKVGLMQELLSEKVEI